MGFPASALMTSRTRGMLYGAGIAIAGIVGYNVTRGADTQTVEGIDNTTLLGLAAALVVFLYLTRK